MRHLCAALAIILGQSVQCVFADELAQEETAKTTPAEVYVDSLIANRKLSYGEGLQLLSAELQAQSEAVKELRPFDDTRLRELTELIEKLVEAPLSHARLMIPRSKEGPAFGVLGECKVVQIIDDSEMHIARGPERIIIKGYPTREFAADQSLVPGGVFSFVGVETYKTAYGFDNSVPVVEPLPPDTVISALANAEHLGVWRKEYGSFRTKFREATEKLLCREWKSADGKYKIRAKLIQYEKGIVTLQRENGSTGEVESKKLCGEDLQYLRLWRKQQRRAATAAIEGAAPDQKNSDEKAKRHDVVMGQLAHRVSSIGWWDRFAEYPQSMQKTSTTGGPNGK